jgi:predicted enzyme related to lactoylglutathione lyase
MPEPRVPVRFARFELRTTDPEGARAFYGRLFLFGVADVERAVATLRAHGGTALPAFPAPSGGLAVTCKDPQGAAFGLIDHAKEAR